MDLDAEARRRLHLVQLWPAQRRAVELLLGGRDTLVVVETGGGKSAVYQLAGPLLDGLTVVVSPLRALQRDQLHGLQEADAGRAALLNADLGVRRRRAVLDDLGAGRLAFLLLSPEQLQNEEVAARLRRRPPALVAVDEAHCVSSWGHDFRPDYLLLGDVIASWGHPVTVALTATAAPPIREDIARVLGLRQPAVVLGGVDRSNLWLGVERHTDGRAKDRAVLERAATTDGAGIVYAATRRRCDDLADALPDAVAYHAGLTARLRREREEEFLAGEVRVVVATTAFGMGIDKPDVRFVLHADAPQSLDAYYQQVGRAGRDGRPSDGVFYYRAEDLGMRRFLASGAPPPADHLVGVLDAVRDHEGGVRRQELVAATGLSARAVGAAVAALAEVGAVTGRRGQRVALKRSGARAGGGAGKETVLDAVAERHDLRRRLSESRVAMLRAHAEGRECRWRQLRAYFGDDTEERCQHCDNCLDGRAEEVARDDGRADGYPVGARVRHEEWGDGEVLEREGDEIVAVFASGYRTLSAQLVEEGGLVRTIGEGAG
ncbi:MAG TPA: RecQ family ATP-dependent DNA helicase [Acidimicrobiales bacterium]|nr:RecQ family ATP-dependent DNA helicase [Acidimicrobiales bacterium]